MTFKDNVDWYDLNDFSDDVELPISPTELWVLNLFVVPLKIEDDFFIPIIYPSYTSKSIDGKLAESEGIWSTPYAADKIELGPFSPSMVGKIRKLYSEYFHDADRVEKCVNDSLYHIGLQSLNIKEIGSFIEYKKSPRRASVWKCYFVRYLFINDLDLLSKKNLVDPNCLRGITFIDAKNYNKYTTLDRKNAHKIYYKGRLLSTNLTYLLNNNILPSHLSSCSKVEKEMLSIKEYGVMVSVDMIGFGKLHEKIIEKFGSIDTTGVQVAHGFLLNLREIFIDLLERYGFFQYKIEGDGFLATSPIRHYNKDPAKQIENAIELLNSLSTSVNELLKNTDLKPSWRVALLVGDYKYGKISTILSNKAEHIGESLVTIARLLESSKEIENSLKLGEVTLTVQNVQYDEYSSVFNSIKYKEKLEREIKIKEHISDVVTLVIEGSE